jgi:carbonic anhydrase
MTLTTGAYHKRGDWPAVEAAPGVERRVLTCGDSMISALDALTRLREGNSRFAENQSSASKTFIPARRAALLDGQEPFAIVLGCSDSRVPAELVFDQGLGDLFVIRVAGNIVAPSQVGSVEFAATRFGTRLVVVMGHSQCGAVMATLEEVLGRATTQSRNLRSIVDRVRPSVETVISSHGQLDLDALMREAVRANVRASTNHLRHGSELLEELIRKEGLLVVGAEYSLETGVATFFDGVPKAG